MKRFRVYWPTCVLLMAMIASPAVATTIVMPSDDQLISKSPLIVEGTVLSSEAVDRDGSIRTESVLKVEKVLKGTAPAEITIREIGGVVGNRITHIYGAPVYTPGERVLAFLDPHPAGGYRTVDLYVGKFTEERSLDGHRLWTRDDEQENVTLLDAGFKPLHGRDIQRDAAGFEHFVGERVAGHDAAMSYGVENPVIDRATGARSGGGLIAAPDFTLISEPTIYRWFAFEQGKAVNWVSSGSQTGYAGGGVSEVQTAIAVWNGASGALIRYAYAGTSSVSPGGLDRPNGVNEVLFNDPTNDISGSWNPKTGGVVGQGGFNGVTNGGKWTSPFTFDAAHPQQTYNTTFNITEGNLTIQDNVSPGTGLSSSILAEIIAHEFGHTLGFGHSADNTALMWSSVTGGGAALRADDLKAAQWLYPNGSTTPSPQPTVPSAPTNLQATLSGSTVTLRWTDNATNETSQSIYLSINNGSYQKLADVAAGATQATLTGFAPGSYRLYVVSSNSAGTSAASNVVTVTVTGTLTASIGVTPATGVANQTLFTFTDESSGTVTSRSWSFGDGATATAPTATHIYSAAGTYNVTLTVQGPNNTSSQATRSVAVTAPAVPLQAAFTYAPSSPMAGQTVSFSDQSTGGITSWSWNFGDGGVSSTQNPQHAYGAAGTYAVTLTVFRNAEASAVTKSITVASSVPVTPAITAQFDLSPAAPVVGQAVAFTDRSTGSPTSWNWNFGDGGVSSLQNPSHTFAAPGNYTVTMTASSAGTSASVARTVAVTSSVTPYRSLISVTAQTDGVGGSQWRTELNLFNAGSESASVDLIFIPGAGASLQSRTIFLGSRQSATYNNALLDLFGISSGAGALAVEATSPTSSPNLKVSSRTFTGGERGTYGQGVPDVTASDLPQTVYIAGLESDSAFRTNIGLVNRSSSPVQATLLLMDAAGAQVGVAVVPLLANSFQQASLGWFFPQSGDHARLTLRVSAGAANALSVYASVVDNITQDPIFLQGLPPATNGRVVIPAVGRAPGINGTFWRSDLNLYNPTGATLALSLRYLPAGADNRNASSRLLAVEAGRTTTLADVLNWFGLSAGSGALEVTWSGGTGPVVSSRTYTTTGNGGTYGQSIDPIASFGSDRWVTGLRSDASYRSNVGFVNDSSDQIGVTLTLLGTSGQQIATGFIALPPKSQAQTSLASLFPAVDVASLGSVTLQAHTDTPNALFAYGSLVDNGSGDPVFYAGR